MQQLPHQYQMKATGGPVEHIHVGAPNINELVIAPPLQFGGPGNEWSPEDLFMASITSCFILSFRAIARASKLTWISLECDSEGLLERIEGKTCFTKVVTTAHLVIPATETIENAEQLLHKADKSCLVANSLTTEMQLKCVVKLGG
jgi:peroxiredoxin-like protein